MCIHVHVHVVIRVYMSENIGTVHCIIKQTEDYVHVCVQYEYECNNYMYIFYFLVEPEMYII